MGSGLVLASSYVIIALDVRWDLSMRRLCRIACIFQDPSQGWDASQSWDEGQGWDAAQGWDSWGGYGAYGKNATWPERQINLPFGPTS